MHNNKIFFAVTLALLFSNPANTQTMSGFKQSTPENEGVSSESILQFLDAAEKSKNELHSFIFLRHDKLIAEGWWYPYEPDLKHTMYSVSKSFTSTAIGFAVSERLLTVDDKVISFFPNDLPDTISPYLSELTIKDLLTMSVGQDPDPTFTLMRDSNWIKEFLSLPIVNEPGTKFLYNSLGPYMLSAIIQKVTGEKVIDYLKPRLFEPLGIKGIDWEVDPHGINDGGWGLRLKTEDMAKFGLLFLRKGLWNGKQILPEKWIEEATTSYIVRTPDLPQSEKDSSDWEQGYGYLFWRCRHNAYRADGAFGQYIIVMPDLDAVIAITAETSDMQDELNLVWKYLLPGIHKDKLPVDKKMTMALNQKLSSLALSLPGKSFPSQLAGVISGKTFSINPNERFIENISFKFEDSICNVTLKTDTADYKISLGSGKWEFGKTTRHGPSLFYDAKAHFFGLPPAKIAGCYIWKDENTLELILRYIESPHTERMVCRFDQNKISIEIHNSFEPASKKMILTGEIR
jgi:Beta-lactamase